MLYFPERESWFTCTQLDSPTGEGLGGVGVVSRGRSLNPICAVYGWNGERYFYEICLITAASLISMSERPHAVAHAKDEQEAVNIANEMSGGEIDIIGDVAQGVFGRGAMVLLAGEIPLVGLDQHEEAIAFLTQKTKELVQ